jgi:hypothetical protein
LEKDNFFWFIRTFSAGGRHNDHWLEAVGKPVSENLIYSNADDVFDPSAASVENLFMVNLNPKLLHVLAISYV